MNDVKVDSNSIEEMYIKYYSPLKRYCIKLVSYNPRYIPPVAKDWCRRWQGCLRLCAVEE